MPAKKLTHAEIRPIKQRVEEQLLSRPGVVGVDINEKVSDGKPTGKLSIVVYVKQKKARNKLSSAEMIPATIDGIPTDVKEENIELQAARVALAEVEPLVDATKYTTLHGGISMGPCRSVYLTPPDVPSAGNYIFVGTFGALVTDRSTKAEMALTNFHVACVDNGWAPGNTQCQPGRVDGGACPTDSFGSLTRAVLSNHVDGAVVAISAGRATDCSIEEIGAVKGQAAAVLNSAVRKRGRTTGLTFGMIDSVDVSLTVNYGDGLGNHTLRNQVRIVPDANQSATFSDHGDSGSVIVDANNNVVALLFAGSSVATYANPIQFVLDELNVDLCVKKHTIFTRPIICQPIVTKPIVCQIQTSPLICPPIITRPVLCNIKTSAVFCNLRTTPVLCNVKTLICPPVTLACPPVSLACRPPGGGGPAGPRAGGEGGGEGLEQLYGAPGADPTDDAFWLGYYAALDALARAEEADGE